MSGPTLQETLVNKDLIVVEVCEIAQGLNNSTGELDTILTFNGQPFWIDSKTTFELAITCLRSYFDANIMRSFHDFLIDGLWTKENTIKFTDKFMGYHQKRIDNMEE